MNHNHASTTEFEDVAKLLQTDLLTGLTSYEARERLKKYGPNRWDNDSDNETVQRFIHQNILGYFSQFANPLIQLLLICVVISAIMGEYQNAISVLIAIVLVCTISFLQERRADKSLERLSKQMPNVCKVIRENQAHEIECRHLVPGDIVYLSEGQRVPADVRLYELNSLSINESNLTGETNSQTKTTAASSKKLAAILNGGSTETTTTTTSTTASTSTSTSTSASASTSITTTSQPSNDNNYIYQNLALMGTMVEAGHSRGIVICTGKSTRYGEVFCMLKNTVRPKSPLQLNIDQLSIHLVVISCSVITMMSILGIVQRRKAIDVAYYAISLAVTAIPEGLPVVVALIMALGVLRLSKQKTIVKSLNSIETLGCIQVLCADKTGTLTRDDMTLTDIVTSELQSLSSSDLEELNNEECRKYMTFNKFGGKLYSIGRLMEVGTLCNNASFNPNPPDGFNSHYMGQATECAILEASMRMGFGDSRTKFDRLSEIPFESKSRRMVVQCQRRDLPSNGPLYYVKGAWEDILNDCKHYYECGLIKPRTEEMWLEYERVSAALGSQGLRVLALATGPSLDQLTFVGVVGINNAPREGIKETLAKLKNNFHIDVKMITGDSQATAVAVGRDLNIIEIDIEDEEKVIMSGEQLEQLLNSEMDEMAKAHEINAKSVFYRVDPIKKASIVSKLQELDKIIAMTGDGVNDVISLKRANLSIVMGHGADVCKEVADIILATDEFSTLIPAIIEGKGIYHKIHSFMTYQISISLSLVCLVSISYVFRTDTPLTVMQLLFINLLTDGPPAQSLGVERIDEKELNPEPRNIHDPILNCHVLKTLFILTSILVSINGFLYYFMLENGKLDEHIRALLFTCFVFCSIFSALSLRSKTKTIFETKLFGNKELFICSFLVISIQIAIVHFEFLNDLFDVEALRLLEIVYLFLYSSLVLIIMDTIKASIRLFKYILEETETMALQNINKKHDTK